MNRDVALAIVAVALTGCATPVVTINKNYYAQPIKTVAYVGFNDATGIDNSGSQVEGIFARYFTPTAYALTGLDASQQAISAKGQSLGNLQDPSDNMRLGNLLGVDAVVSGWITEYTDTSEATVIVDEPVTETETRFRNSAVVNSDGSIGSKPHMFTKSVTTDNYVPETETLPARVGLGVHLINTKTGEALWNVSFTGDGSNLSAAAENTVSQIVSALQHDIDTHQGQ